MPDRDAPPPAVSTHPLLHAGKWLVSDLLSTLVFVGLYAVTHSIYVAIGLAIAVGLGRIGWQTRRGVPIDSMQWLSLLLVTVFGGAALITHDPRFIMIKPTLIYAAIGAVMLKPGWMNRYVPPIVQEYGSDVTTMFGYLWASLMFATSAANLLAVWLASPIVWGWFIAIFPITSKLALFAVQYTTTRAVVRRRIRAAKVLAVPAS